MKLGKKLRSTPKLLLYFLVVGGVLLASCSPQVVEVEKEVVVTQIVREEVIVEKEVPVEVEVIKEVVNEVTVTEEVISPISYVAIGLGVILVVIAGVLYSRTRNA